MHPEFSFSPRYKILSYLTAAFMVGGGACLAVMPNPTPLEHLMPFILPIIGVLYIIRFLRKKVIIEQDTITSVTTFGKKQLALDEIEGIKIEEKAIVLVPKSPRKNDLYIHDYKQLKDSELLVDFLKSIFRNIDRLKFQQGVVNQVYDSNYGFTPQQRQASIEKYNKVASFINAAGLIFTFTIFIPLAIFKAVAIALPPLCIFLVFITNKRLKLSSKYGPAAYPVLGTAYIFPIFTLFFKALLGYDLYNFNNLWVPSLSYGGLMTILYYVVDSDDMGDIKKIRVIIPMTLLYFAYSFASVRVINCEFDNSAGRLYKPVVLQKEASQGYSEHGTKQTHYLSLSAWGPLNEPRTIEVNEEFYSKIHIGDTIPIKVKPGLLNIPWFVVSR